MRNVAATIQKGEGKFLVNVVCHFEGATNDHPYLFAIWLNYSAPWTNNRIQEVHDSKSTSNENEATITGYNHFILNTTIQVQEVSRKLGIIRLQNLKMETIMACISCSNLLSLFETLTEQTSSNGS